MKDYCEKILDELEMEQQEVSLVEVGAETASYTLAELGRRFEVRKSESGQWNVHINARLNGVDGLQFPCVGRSPQEAVWSCSDRETARDRRDFIIADIVRSPGNPLYLVFWLYDSGKRRRYLVEFLPSHFDFQLKIPEAVQTFAPNNAAALSGVPAKLLCE